MHLSHGFSIATTRRPTIQSNFSLGLFWGGRGDRGFVVPRPFSESNRNWSVRIVLPLIVAGAVAVIAFLFWLPGQHKPSPLLFVFALPITWVSQVLFWIAIYGIDAVEIGLAPLVLVVFPMGLMPFVPFPLGAVTGWAIWLLVSVKGYRSPTYRKLALSLSLSVVNVVVFTAIFPLGWP